MIQYLTDLAVKVWADLKRAHTSFTLWFNVAGVPTLVAFWPQVMDALPSIAAALPGDRATQVTAIAAIVNALLRFKTNKALADK